MPGTSESEAIRANFSWLCLWFAVCHGCVTSPLIYASSVLEEQVGLSGNSVLYAATVASGLLASVPIIRVVGLKSSLMLGMALYTLYLALFSFAALLARPDMFRAAPLWSAVSFYLGSGCGGLGAGLLWISQGSYLGRGAALVAQKEGRAHDQVSGELAGEFAIYYLAFEFACKLGFSVLQGLGLEAWVVGIVYTCISIISLVMMARIGKLTVEAESEAEGGASKFLAVVRLWSDPMIWLLSPTNIAFGFSSAYLGGHFNAQFLTPELGKGAVGAMGALVVACAVVLVKVYGLVAARCGKGVSLTAGAVSFALIPVLVLLGRCCTGWSRWIAVIYILQGSGRAVYESTNKAIFSDFFKGGDIEGAFANCFVQMSLASSVCFYMSKQFSGTAVALCTLVFACLTPLVYALAVTLRERRGEEVEPLVSKPRDV